MPSLWVHRPLSKPKRVTAQTRSELVQQIRLCWSVFRVNNHLSLYTWPKGEHITHTKQIRSMKDNDRIMAIGVRDNWNEITKSPMIPMNNSDCFRKMVAVNSATRVQKERDAIHRRLQVIDSNIQHDETLLLHDSDQMMMWGDNSTVIKNQDYNDEFLTDVHDISDGYESDDDEDLLDNASNVFNILKDTDFDDYMKPKSFDGDDNELRGDTPIPPSSEPIPIARESSNTTLS